MIETFHTILHMMNTISQYLWISTYDMDDDKLLNMSQ